MLITTKTGGHLGWVTVGEGAPFGAPWPYPAVLDFFKGNLEPAAASNSAAEAAVVAAPLSL